MDAPTTGTFTVTGLITDRISAVTADISTATQIIQQASARLQQAQMVKTQSLARLDELEHLLEALKSHPMPEQGNEQTQTKEAAGEPDSGIPPQTGEGGS